jgi:hypothetical protein
VLKAAHEKILDDQVCGFLHNAVEVPSQALREHRGLPESREQHEHVTTLGHSASHDIFAAGTVEAGSDVIALRLVAEPTDRVLESVSKH